VLAALLPIGRNHRWLETTYARCVTGGGLSLTDHAGGGGRSIWAELATPAHPYKGTTLVHVLLAAVPGLKSSVWQPVMSAFFLLMQDEMFADNVADELLAFAMPYHAVDAVMQRPHSADTGFMQIFLGNMYVQMNLEVPRSTLTVPDPVSGSTVGHTGAASSDVAGTGATLGGSAAAGHANTAPEGATAADSAQAGGFTALELPLSVQVRVRETGDSVPEMRRPTLGVNGLLTATLDNVRALCEQHRSRLPGSTDGMLVPLSPLNKVFAGLLQQLEPVLGCAPAVACLMFTPAQVLHYLLLYA
jgi:hypothetical protein